MLFLRHTLAFCAFFFCAAAAANLAVTVEVKDPINGDTVTCTQMASFSYFDAPWREAYELGVSPFLLLVNLVCENPRSGYIAYLSDFNTLSEAERSRIRRWLQQHYRRPPQRGSDSDRRNGSGPLRPALFEAMKRLEALYDLRDLPAEYRDQIRRVMAIVYKLAGQDRLYRARLRESIAFAQRQLAASAAADQANDLRTLLVEYHLRLGETKAAESYLAEVARTQDAARLASLWFRFGQHHFAVGDFQQTCRYLRLAWNGPSSDPQAQTDWQVKHGRTALVELERRLPKAYQFIDADWEGKPNPKCAWPGR